MTTSTKASSSVGGRLIQDVVTNPKDGRQVSYCLVQPPNSNPNVTVVYFYPLSGTSTILKYLADSLTNYTCQILCVDRPQCGDTSDVPKTNDDDNDNDDNDEATTKDWALHRIDTHVQDIMAVLKVHDTITQIYALGVCLGHPFCIAFCEEIVNNHSDRLKLNGLTLVAPFVSTCCPQSWNIARLGANVPSLILYGATELLLSIGSLLNASLLTPKVVQKLISSGNQNSSVEFTIEDYEQIVQVILESSQLTKNVKGPEARFGTCQSWQKVCDDFLLNIEEEKTTTTFQIRIHAAPNDKITPIESIEWVTKRCYENTPITIHDEIHGHELMTFFGGPFRNPVLLHQIIQEWNLLLLTE